MRVLRFWLLLVVSFSSLEGRAQQLALMEAPDAVARKSNNSREGNAVAIAPVATHASAVRHEELGAYDWSLLGAAAALRFLDYRSTVQCVSEPPNCREVELPQALVHNKAGLGAFEASTVAADYFVYRAFVTHHHRKIARLGQSINVAAMGGTVGWNYYELNVSWHRRSHSPQP
jgi:hypothetical protein